MRAVTVVELDGDRLDSAQRRSVENSERAKPLTAKAERPSPWARTVTGVSVEEKRVTSSFVRIVRELQAHARVWTEPIVKGPATTFSISALDERGGEGGARDLRSRTGSRRRRDGRCGRGRREGDASRFRIRPIVGCNNGCRDGERGGGERQSLEYPTHVVRIDPSFRSNGGQGPRPTLFRTACSRRTGEG